MQKRQAIQTQVKRLNEGNPEAAKTIADIYSAECADEYQKMMKSLNSIKTLKIEIDQYTNEGSSLVVEEESKKEEE